jgi:hypothetical protein
MSSSRMISSSLMVLLRPASACRIFISRLIFFDLTKFIWCCTGLQNLYDAFFAIQQTHTFEHLRVFAATDLSLACVVGTVAKSHNQLPPPERHAVFIIIVVLATFDACINIHSWLFYDCRFHLNVLIIAVHVYNDQFFLITVACCYHGCQGCYWRSSDQALDFLLSQPYIVLKLIAFSLVRVLVSGPYMLLRLLSCSKMNSMLGIMVSRKSIVSNRLLDKLRV